MKAIFLVWFVLRWIALAIAILIMLNIMFHRFPTEVGVIGVLIVGCLAIANAYSHVRRVSLVAGDVERETLATRHRRQVEIPFPADEAFDLVEAAVRELPRVEGVESARDSLQVRARVRRIDPYLGTREDPATHAGWTYKRRRPSWNLVLATVKPGERTSTLTLVCEPDGGALVEWFTLDQGTNLENADAITRAVSRRIAGKRQGEETATRETQVEKTLALAKLATLHAQVEPHFLYNTLASAQILTRSDPARADAMLGHLITYLRHSMPREDEPLVDLGSELERARAYLEIMRIRMGERLGIQVQVPDAMKAVRLPPMALQTLVENAIKHGLEPLPGGGTVWILAREADGRAAITVADDGRGFSDESSGTGIGLRNLRERLKLAYGTAASFAIAANFPRGVAATITVPSKETLHA